MGFQWMCFPNSQIESYIRFFVLLLKEMQHNSLKSMKKSMKIKEKISIFDINLRLYILHNIQWFKHEPTSGHWFLVRRFYKVRTMIMTLKIVPKKFGSMVFPWHGHDVCYSLLLSTWPHSCVMRTVGINNVSKTASWTTSSVNGCISASRVWALRRPWRWCRPWSHVWRR